MKKSALLALLGLSLACASTPLRDSLSEYTQCYAREWGRQECQRFTKGCSEPTRIYHLNGYGTVEHSWSDTDGDCQIDKLFHSLDLEEGINVKIVQEQTSPEETYTKVCLSTSFELGSMCFGITNKKGKGITDIYRTTSDQELEEVLILNKPYCREEGDKVICPFPGLRRKGGELLGQALISYGGIPRELLLKQ
ncbi:MAG: hypothetical protein WCV90_02700 [Candidatus Woesearchaeota archaeon]|jgi:hypothetical protein